MPCPPVDAAGPGTVIIKNLAYSPNEIVVKMHEQVTWQWQEDAHSVTADDASFDSGVFNTGHTFSRTFPATGVFPYHCSVHGLGMAGTVRVVM